MFSSKSKAEPVIPVSANKIDTIIGEKTRVEGTLHTQDTTRIDGRIKGEAISDGYLIIGENGYVEGDIRSENMLIAGTVQGNIFVRERLEVTENGKIIGDITTKSLIIAEGASFAGKCTMTSLQKVQDGVQKEAEKHVEANRKEQKAAEAK